MKLTNNINGSFAKLHKFVWQAIVTLTMFCASVSSIQAQQIIPLPSKNDNLTVYVDSVLLVHQADSANIALQFRFLLMGGTLPRQERIVISPLLTNGDSLLAFPTVEVDGNWAYYHQVRKGEKVKGERLKGEKVKGEKVKGADSAAVFGAAAFCAADSTLSAVDSLPLQYRSKEVITYQTYTQLAPAPCWMQDASLCLRVERTNACGGVLCSDDLILREPTPVITTTKEEDTQLEHILQLQGRAYVSFPVNRTEVRPTFRNNEFELSRLHHTIDSISRDSTVEIMRIQIKGYASPEGKYANNDRLARERTSSLTRYIIEHTNVSPVLFKTAYEAEDWDGLRTFVDTTSMLTNSEALLQIIDTEMEPDAKLARILREYPADYAVLKEQAFPQLRHTDYQINYTLKNFTRQEGEEHSDTIYRLYTDTLSNYMAADTLKHRFGRFPSRFALKTNLLYWLVLAPNIEFEMTIDRERRTSLMAEYATPWFRWDKKEYSYELQYAGLELRRWITPRCDEGRPFLSGSFIGPYVATGKYDLETRGTGDQGEFISVGLTYGYSWPIDPRWNLEFSISAGYLGGERRHYNTMFESTHLIYRYTKDFSYIGPTKVKFSLVWIL